MKIEADFRAIYAFNTVRRIVQLKRELAASFNVDACFGWKNIGFVTRCVADEIVIENAALALLLRCALVYRTG
jgi:hypothetical protein